MQWWSNPSARSHLEAWVNIWVRSAGLALVLAGWLLVGAKEGERDVWLLLYVVFFCCCCFCRRVSCDKQSAKCAWRMQRSCVWTIYLNAADHFCNDFLDIKRGLGPAKCVLSVSSSYSSLCPTN